MFLIGQAIDTHKIKKTNKKNKITLGGFCFLSNYKIIAHSDGDVVLHAIANSLLGAVQAGDIGQYFSDKDPKNKNLDSKKILSFAMNKIKKYEINNIDLTIQCEKIILNNLKKDICASLSKLLKTKKVNVKATRFEKNEDYITCYVSCLLRLKKII